MEDIKFKNLDELYNRLKPALHSKLKELGKFHIFYIKEEDIWNYLTEVKWHNANNLTLAEMVSDILRTNNDDLKDYVDRKLWQTKLKERDNNLL